jgi:hypothetical protein
LMWAGLLHSISLGCTATIFFIGSTNILCAP